MLTAKSSSSAHRLRSAALLALSFLMLPIDTLIVILSYPLCLLAAIRAPPCRPQHSRTVLVTGMGMTKGLTLARLFYRAGHRVVGAEFEPEHLPISCGHVSRAVTTFHRLPRTDGSREAAERYCRTMLDIIQREKVDLWVSCSSLPSAFEDGQAKELVERLTRCRAVQFDAATTQKLHEKHSFFEHARSLGLTVPQTHTVTSHAAVLEALSGAEQSGKKFIMKYVGMDDSVRGDMTKLPLDTPAATEAHISRLQISETRPWVLQEHIDGPEFCTHAVVVRGQVKSFVACPSAELLMHYESLPPDSPLSRSMLRFTQDFAASFGEALTGHLAFDFLAYRNEARVAEKYMHRDVTVYPVECNPRAHTAVALFSNTLEVVEGYLSVLETPDRPSNDEDSKGSSSGRPVYPRRPARYHWVGHDLVTLVFLPWLSLFSTRHIMSAAGRILKGSCAFLDHLIFWKDGTFELWDPLPAWWLYHVYWPFLLARALLRGEKWSRINVSVARILGC